MMRDRSRHCWTSIHARRRGLSLAEVVISTLLVGLVMVTALSSVAGASRSWIAGAQQADGQALARALLTEIIAMPFEDPNQTPVFGLESGESGASRAALDDVDDYKDWTDTPPKDKAGTALTGYSGWSRTCDVIRTDRTTYADMADNATGINDLARIRVTVTSPAGKTTTLDAYRARPAGAQQSQGVDLTVVTYVGVKLGMTGATPVTSGTAIVNHAEDR